MSESSVSSVKSSILTDSSGSTGCSGISTEEAKVSVSSLLLAGSSEKSVSEISKLAGSSLSARVLLTRVTEVSLCSPVSSNWLTSFLSIQLLSI